MRRAILQAGVIVIALAVVAGDVRADLDVDTVRGTLLLAEEPGGAVTLTAAREKLTTKPQPVVIVGRIAGRGAEPFVEGKASFSLLDVPDDHAAKPGHKPEDCPFCKKKAANAPIAAVRFVGADGKELPVDARKLFGVEAGSVVVVRGSGVFDPKLGIPVLQITADGIHVRPAAK